MIEHLNLVFAEFCRVLITIENDCKMDLFPWGRDNIFLILRRQYSRCKEMTHQLLSEQYILNVLLPKVYNQVLHLLWKYVICVTPNLSDKVRNLHKHLSLSNLQVCKGTLTRLIYFLSFTVTGKGVSCLSLLKVVISQISAWRISQHLLHTMRQHQCLHQ